MATFSLILRLGNAGLARFVFQGVWNPCLWHRSADPPCEWLDDLTEFDINVVIFGEWSQETDLERSGGQ